MELAKSLLRNREKGLALRVRNAVLLFGELQTAWIIS